MTGLRLRHVAGVNPPIPDWDRIPDDELLTFVPLEAVWPGRMDYSRRRPKAEVSTGYTRFVEGDVLVPKITPTFEADRSTVVAGLPSRVAAGTTELHVIRPSRSVDARYVSYLVSSRPFLHGGEARMIGVAGQKRVPDDWLRDCPVPVSGLATQRSIADFLDCETTRIDALITAKRRMISLLDEQRSHFISHAVTHGAWDQENAVPTRNEFAPLIPRHWRLVRLKHVVHRIVDTAHKTAPEVVDGRFLVVRTSNVKGGRLLLEDARYTDEETFREWTERAVPRPGDIMFTREAPAGEACLVPEDVPLCIGQRMVLIQVDKSKLLPEFGLHSLYSGAAQEFIRLLSRSTTVAHLNMADIPDLPIALPPMDEQREIVLAVGRVGDRVNKLKNALVRQIDLLVERRQALITAAVTGELEIPGVAA